MQQWLLLLSLFSIGCSSNTGTGALSGIVIGASSGSFGAGSTGAWIGTASGLVAGSIVGAILDIQDKRVMEKSSPRTVDRMERNEPLTINDVIKLSQNGVNDETILSYLKTSQGTYTLSRAQIQRLQDAGVSQRIINQMLRSSE